MENVSTTFTDDKENAVAQVNNTEESLNKLDETAQENQNVDTDENQATVLPFSKILDTGVHIGLAVNHWNPKMKPYIYQKRRKYCVLNAQKILTSLQQAFDYLKQVSTDNGQILVIDTRNRYVQAWIKENCVQLKNVHFVVQRWLGGTLTNSKTINNSIEKLNSLTELKNSPDFGRYTKKEQIEINKKLDRLVKFFGGIVNMKGLPNVIIVTDPISSKSAVVEAMKLNIPVIALANTNANPEMVNYLVPCNTHSPRSVILVLSALLDAIRITNEEEPKVAFKKDEEIELPFFSKIEHPRKIVNYYSKQRK